MLQVQCGIPVLPGYLDGIKDVDKDGKKGFAEVIELRIDETG